MLVEIRRGKIGRGTDGAGAFLQHQLRLSLKGLLTKNEKPLESSLLEY